MHFIFNAEDTTYGYWQGELMAYTYRKVGQAGRLTRLLSCDDSPTRFAFSYDTVRVHSYSIHPRSRDRYLAYNKPASIVQWMEAVRPRERTIVVLDPDCLFLRSISVEAKAGRPAGHVYSYMDPQGGLGSLIFSRHCRRNRNLGQSVGIPLVIHRDDLRAVAPRWLEATREIRDDAKSHAATGWIAEMFGYTVAAAELGLVHETRRLCVFPGEDSLDAPFMHYCSPSEHKALGFHWHKVAYKPWEPPPVPPPGSPKAALVLAELLKEAAEVYGNAAFA
jgi:hypothetical protein